MKEKDVFGKALEAYFHNQKKQVLTTWTNLTEEDDVPLSYFFRDYKQMPKIEKKALELAKGRVLDVGCGSGSHSLYLQNHKKLNVTALDISEGAIKVAQKRGVSQTKCASIWDFQNQKFDSILMLMNGMGIGKSIKKLPLLINHLKSLLTPEGSIFVDSSDLIYLFDEEDIALWEKDEVYYGEINYGIRFENETEEFSWLYVDPRELKKACIKSGLNFKIIEKGPNLDYLAKLTF
ncbi:MAG: class I SAM-dependent methyltransferase [Flavobacteriaceae bacterium]|nr:class I SAM-dependent methyltransferase [Flavobacteriaceae bacterium]